MNRLFFVFILVGLAACCTSRQAAPPPPQIDTIRDTITVPVPEWRDTGTIPLPPLRNLRRFFPGMEKTLGTVKMTQRPNPTRRARRRYRVEVGAKPDTIFVTVTDTIRIQCPDVALPPAQGQRFPWESLAALIGAILVWFVTKRRNKDTD